MRCGTVDARRHQKGRPIDRMEADDILADDVKRRRPIALEFFAAGIWKTDTRNVIRKRVHPHIHDVSVGSGHADAPVERCARDR